MANPTGKGGWTKGQSGNPGGRPKVVADVRDAAREYTQSAIETLATIMDDEGAPPAARVAAANSLLDRGYGRAPAHLTTRNEDSFVSLLEAVERGCDGEREKTPIQIEGKFTDAQPDQSEIN